MNIIFLSVGVRSRVQSDSAGTIFLVYAEDNGGQVGMKDDGSLYISRQGSKIVNKKGQLNCKSATKAL